MSTGVSAKGSFLRSPRTMEQPAFLLRPANAAGRTGYCHFSGFHNTCKDLTARMASCSPPSPCLEHLDFVAGKEAVFAILKQLNATETAAGAAPADSRFAAGQLLQV